MAGNHFRSPNRAGRLAIHIREQQPISGGLPDAETQRIALPGGCSVQPVVDKGKWHIIMRRLLQQHRQLIGRTVVDGDNLRACWPLLALHCCPPRRPMLGVVFDAYDDTDRAGLDVSARERKPEGLLESMLSHGQCRPPNRPQGAQSSHS